MPLLQLLKASAHRFAQSNEKRVLRAKRRSRGEGGTEGGEGGMEGGREGGRERAIEGEMD